MSEKPDRGRDDQAGSPQKNETAELRAEVERLGLENDRLAAARSEGSRGELWRTRGALALTIIAAVLLTFAVSAVWLDRVVFDTETWVSTVAPLSSDPAIQEVVADVASDAIIERLDAEAKIQELLPDQYGLDRLSPLLASSVESAVRNQATKLVQSDRFGQLWEETNRQGHEALIAAVEGREGIIGAGRGAITVDTGLLVDEVKSALQERGLDFVAAIPSDQLGKTIVIYQSDTLAAAGPIFDALRQAAYVLPIAGILAAAAAFALSKQRRRVALWLGVSIVVAGILPLQALYLGQYVALDRIQAMSNISPDAAQRAFDIIFRDLVVANRTLTALGLVIFLGALIAGPARWATAIRGGLSGGMAEMGSRLELGAFGGFVAGHKRDLRTGGLLGTAAILLLLPTPRTIADILTLTAALAVWLLAVEFFGAGSKGEPAMDDEDEDERDEDG